MMAYTPIDLDYHEYFISIENITGKNIIYINFKVKDYDYNVNILCMTTFDNM